MSGQPASRPRRQALIIGAITATVVALLVVVSVSVGGYPFTHSVCKVSNIAESGPTWVPLTLLNSPYGGSASVQASIPVGWFGSSPNSNPPQVISGSGTNGSIWGAFFEVNATLYRDGAQSVWGPGPANACSGSWSLTLESLTPSHGFQGELFTWSGAPEFGPNSTSDVSEPEQVHFYDGPGGNSSVFHNGFVGANQANLSTCNGLPMSISIRSSSLTTWINFNSGGSSTMEPASLPFEQSFEYNLPANFGTWQVDNLSASGGPGGGWAFNFLGPCS